jgi:hypothetical protein
MGRKYRWLWYWSTKMKNPARGGVSFLAGIADRQAGDMPRNLSDRRRNSSTVVSRAIEITTSIVATAKIVGLICSRRPVNICQGKVF